MASIKIRSFFIYLIWILIVPINFSLSDTNNVKISSKLLERDMFLNISKNFSQLSSSAGFINKNKIKKKKTFF